MKKNFFRSKLFLSVIVLIVVAFLAFWLLPNVYEQQNQTMNVVQLTSDVELGTQITEKMLTTRTIGKYGVDSAVIVTTDSIVGKYAAADLRRGTNLYPDQFSESWTDVEGAVDKLLEVGNKLVTVSLSSGAASVGGLVTPGSLVDVLTMKPIEVETDEFGYGYNGATTATELEQTVLLREVLVYELLNSELDNIAELTRKWKTSVEEGTEEDIDDSLIPAFVTLIVDDEQALALANQEYSGEVHLVLIPDIDGDGFADLPEEDIPEEESAVETDEDQVNATINETLDHLMEEPAA